MGQAKCRGTYEQRKAKAIEREANKPKPIVHESKLTPQEGNIWRY